jgi:hypothetical protein
MNFDAIVEESHARLWRDAEQLLRDTCAAFERKHLPREGNA